MQNAIRSACREGKNQVNTRIGGKKSYLARRRRWLAAFLAVLWRRLVAATCSRTATPGGAAAVSDGLVRSLRSSLSLHFLGLLFFLLFSGWSFLSSRSSSLFFRSPLFLLSPSFYLFPSLSSVFFVFSLLPPLCSLLSLLIAVVLAVIYRAK